MSENFTVLRFSFKMQGKRKVVEVLLVAVIIPSLILVTQVKGQKISDCNLDTDYMCSDGSNCIPKNYLCNNYKDCDNNDDEENCGESSSLILNENVSLYRAFTDLQTKNYAAVTCTLNAVMESDVYQNH